MAIAGGFGVVTVRNWDAASALEGSFHWFGVLVAVEVVAAGAGCAVLARAKASRWMAWWVAIVIAVHFVPLGILLTDWSVAAFGLIQTAGLVWFVRRLRHAECTTSRVVGPWMGATLLGYALISALLYLV